MIKKLSKEVINKIAAGEVIQRPYNVIKQLIENAIDAEATQIRVTIAQGGIQLIQIVDNGKGIMRDDFPLLCQRFATSKIGDLSDLQTIQSFGFRGEALASLSYVSDLEITSKHKDANIGYKCTFKGERMVDSPQPISVNTGTKIRVNELFCNLQTRRASLNAIQEKKRIIKLISHFALHYHYIKFSIESEKGSQLSTDFRSYKTSQSKMKVFQLITKLPYDKFAYMPKQILQDIYIEAIISKLNTIKSKTVLLNVNNRIVESPEILKSIQRAYSECYQSIHEENQSFFVYLSIDLDPKKIDCNKHPSKKVVGFYTADRLYDNIYKWVLEHIKQESSIKNITTNVTKSKLNFNVNTSMINKTFNSQSNYFNTQPDNIENQPSQLDNYKEDKNINESKTQQMNQKPVYAYNKNRMDTSQMPINFYMKNRDQLKQTIKQLKFKPDFSPNESLQQPHIKQFFKHITYVGCFNLNFIFIHLENRLYLMNVLPFLESFMREWLKNNTLVVQDVLDRYAQLDLKQIIIDFLKNKKLESKIKVDDLVDKVLINRHLLFKNYGITINENSDSTNGTITSFPILQKFMSDCLIPDQLAYFLCRLFGKEPSQLQRENYFIDFLVSLFMQSCQIGQVKMQQQNSKRQLSPMNDRYSQFLRDKVIPLLKTKCRHYKPIVITDYLTEMLDLKDVYKIFERC